MNTRIGVRVPEDLRKKMNAAVEADQYKDLSQLIRVAVEKLLEVTVEA